jgi:hypothetical protein
MKLTRIRSLVSALLVAGLSTLIAVASVLADGGNPPFPH